jgi:hypothetical protein
MTSHRIIILFALISVVGFDLAAIKPRFPQQFTATIFDSQGSYSGYPNYPCLFDSINRREKCQLNDNNNVYRIRNFSNDTFTETNYTTEFPSKCNISTNNINGAKILDPDWFDKLNLSLVSISRDPYSSNILYTWVFTLKKPSLLEELPFAPKLIRIYDPRLGAIIQQFKKIRNIVGEIQKIYRLHLKLGRRPKTGTPVFSEISKTPIHFLG